ncbi:MAG: nuclear transport factor 2 family protein [Sphingobium sp.]|nr:nuclear transport factor 2 family protein [Sphingobium sp.]MBP9158519.1 nuclear transport factor 2 family protein [Sphingobium sp.]
MEHTDRRMALGTLLALGTAATATGEAKAASHSTHNSLAQQVEELMSRAQISEVLLDYARGNDRLDEAMIRSCFWPESTHKHGKFDGKSSDFVVYAAKILGGLKYTAHHISNISIKVDGDRAFTESYYFAHHRRPAKEGGSEEDAFFEGRYLDDFERRGGVWKIIRRRGLSDYSAPPQPAPSAYADWPAGVHSVRGTEDDYYTMLAKFMKR